DRLLAHTSAPAWTITNAPEGPQTTTIAARQWDPVVGDGTKLATHLAELARDGYRVNVCAEGKGTGARITAGLNENGLDVAFDETDQADLARPGLRVVVQPLERGFVLPSIKLAVLAESDVTGRRRAHRPPRSRRRASEGFFEDLQPGDYVVHY